MLKILYLPLNTKPGDQNAVCEAWRQNEVNLEVFDYYLSFLRDQNVERVNQEFLDCAKKFQPDLITMQLQMTDVIQPETLQKVRSLIDRKVIITNWSGDIRNTPSNEILKIDPVVDYTFISSTGQIELHKSAGAKNVAYWQIGYDPKIFFPETNRQTTFELAFAGNAYSAGTFADSKLRTDTVLFLKEKLGNKFALHGSGYPPRNKIRGLEMPKTNSLYNSSRAIFNMSNYNDVSHYFSDRLLICLASGRPVISWRFPNYETYFTNGVDILVANSKEEILDLLKWIQNNSESAEKIGQQGAYKVRQQHTYKSRAAELLYLVGLR